MSISGSNSESRFTSRFDPSRQGCPLSIGPGHWQGLCGDLIARNAWGVYPHVWDVRAGHPRLGQVVVVMIDASANMMSVEPNFRVLIAQRWGGVDLPSVSTDEDPGSGHLPAGAVVHRAAPPAPAAGGR